MSKKTKIILAIIGLVLVLIVVTAFIKTSSERPGTLIGGGVYEESAMAPGEMSLSMRAGVTKQMAAYDGDFESGVEIIEDSSLNTDETTERLIIKTGSFSIVVDDVNMAVKLIADYAVEKGGFLVSSNIYKSGVAPYATVVVRIPAEIFDEGVEEYKKLGELTSESVDGRDVTEEYVDLEAQLGNLRATESQFLEIMKKAQKIEDILAVQRELTTVRGQIERIEGRMKYLKTSADMSTITVHLSTDPGALPVVDEEDKWKPWGEFKEAVRNLLELAKALSYLIIWFVVFIPLWLVLVLLFFVAYKLLKKYLIK